jgi:CDGSH-type Zn-finger protein
LPPLGPAGAREILTSALAFPAWSGANCGMRKVLKSELRPLEIKPQEKSVWICMCGLSKNQPFCDGSHKAIGEEEDGKIYEYDAQGHRVEG